MIRQWLSDNTSVRYRHAMGVSTAHHSKICNDSLQLLGLSPADFQSINKHCHVCSDIRLRYPSLTI